MHWDNVCLASGRYSPSLNVQYVRDFVAKYAAFFQRAHAVVIERQTERRHDKLIWNLFFSYFFNTHSILLQVQTISNIYSNT